MKDAVCRALAEEIYGKGSEQALTITFHQVAFDPKGKAQLLDDATKEFPQAVETHRDFLGLRPFMRTESSGSPREPTLYPESQLDRMFRAARSNFYRR